MCVFQVVIAQGSPALFQVHYRHYVHVFESLHPYKIFFFTVRMFSFFSISYIHIVMFIPNLTTSQLNKLNAFKFDEGKKKTSQSKKIHH